MALLRASSRAAISATRRSEERHGPFGSTSSLFLLQRPAMDAVLLSLIAFVGGGIVGLAVALARTRGSARCGAATAGYIHLFQGTPLLMQLFLVYYGLGAARARARCLARGGDRA